MAAKGLRESHIENHRASGWSESWNPSIEAPPESRFEQWRQAGTLRGRGVVDPERPGRLTDKEPNDADD